MDLKIISRSKEHLVLEIRNVHYTILNSLVRLMIEEVPTFAIENVFFEHNESLLHEEMIAHRLGLLPIGCDNIDDYPFCQDCPCENDYGCEKCTARFTLDVQCEPNSRKRTVVSQDLVSQSPGFRVDVPNISITVLGPNQRIKCHCIAKKGTGKEHAKWSPVTVAFYEHINYPDDAFRFEIEAVDGLDAAWVFQRALDIFKSKCAQQAMEE